MKANKYQVLVTVDGIHRFMDHEIGEVHIPEKDIVFNEEGYCFRSESRNQRSESETVEVPDSFIPILENFLEYERNMKFGIQHYFKKEENDKTNQQSEK